MQKKDFSMPAKADFFEGDKGGINIGRKPGFFTKIHQSEK
jgi:hypothetical protein